MKDHTPDTNIGAICASHGMQPARLLEVLHDVQAGLGYIPAWAALEIAGHLNISRADVQGVVSFYDDFHEDKQPENTIRVCRAEACQALGSNDLELASSEHIAVHKVYCLGNCALAPAVQVNGKLFGRVDQARLEKLAGELKRD